MRRRKLVIAVILLMTWAATAADDVWNDPPFLKSPYTNDTLVRWNETCTIEATCAMVYLKEGIEGNFEILRLNANSKPVLLTIQNNIIGLEVGVDDKTPKYFLQSKNPGDYEGSTIQFKARFNKDQSSSTYTAIIKLDNVNDNEPIIEAPKECEVVEEYVGETNCVFNVKDIDGSACYTKMTSSDSHFTFVLEGEQKPDCKDAKYRLYVVEALDYETYRLHSMTIMAHDEGQVGPNTFLEPRIVLDVSLSFVVTVGDIPDMKPMWKTMMPSIQVEELREQTQQFTAIDGDIGLNWKIEYHIETEFEYFTIDKDSGLLTIEKIDRDKTQVDVYNLVIYATEVPEEPFLNETALDISDVIVVVVKDINNNVPSFEKLEEIDFPIYMDEGNYFSEELYTVIDPDLALNGTFSIEFLEDDKGHSSNFMVVPTTGYQKSTITVTSINASKLDYEDVNWRTITLKFVAKESADPSHEGFANVTIILRDVNDEPPIFDESQYSVSVNENQEAGELIVTVHATDRDEGDYPEYFMRSNSVSNILEVDSGTGAISTIDKAFDYERQTEIVFQVYAKDTAPIPHQASCEVQINIININDEKPQLSLPFEAKEIEEHSDIGIEVSDVISATDPDLELAELHFFINWTATQAFKNGILVKSREVYEGVLVLKDTILDNDEWKTYLVINDKERFDWEKFESLRVNIVVNDTQTEPGYEHNQVQNGYVTVTVVDINDCAPVFTEDSDTYVDVVENNTNIRLVGAVRATDNDSTPYANITYSIEALSPSELVDNPLQLIVDDKTGQLYTSGVEFDCEQFEEMEYVYVITASDGDPEHEAYHKITVRVEDINDNAPTYYEEIPPDVLNPEIYEEQEGRIDIVCLNAEDKDRTIPFNVTTYFMENEYLFEMEDNCLKAVDGTLLDREGEGGELRQLTIYTRDNHIGGNKYNSNEGQKVVIKLTLLDINDNAPQLQQLEQIRVIEKEATPEKFLVSIEVEDPDKGINGTIDCKWMDVVVTYPLDRTDVNDHFELETSDTFCHIRLKKDLLWGDYIIHLNVSDRGVPVSLTNAMSYDLIIANLNSRRPVIEKPKSGTIYRILRDVLSKGEEPLRDFYNETIEDFEVTDGDDPRLPYGLVELKIYGGGTMFRLKQVTKDPTVPAKFRLIKDESPDPGDRKLEMYLEANDRDKDELKSDKVPISIYFIDPSSVPEFDVHTFETQFTENSTGLKEKHDIPKAINDAEELLEGETREVFYYITEGDKRFELYNNTRTLILKDELDYEVDTEHKLIVVATHLKEVPDNPPTTSVLAITVQVIDENDMPPEFSQRTYYGVFRIYDTSEKDPVASVNATDVDTNDVISYEFIKGTLTASTPSLQELIRDDLFRVDKSTGDITRNFSPGGKDLSGFFEFQVVAYDKAGNVEGHRDVADVRVYVVSEKHQVIFNFFDLVEDVQKQREKICPALTTVLTFSCSVEQVTGASKESQAKGANTDVYTHFINNDKNSPVESSTITSMVLEGDTYSKLTRAMTDLHLSLVSFTSPRQPEEDSMAMTIVLAAVCAVLGVLVIVFSLAFVVRTRTLNQRLEKLTMKKFGSQDSGLNRETLAVPGTNRHALEGSNPVWNHEIDPNFDAQSDVSGDSDLIGIEDSPEFGGTGRANPAYERDVIQTKEHPPTYEQSIQRRTSINPLAAQAEASNDPYGFSEPLGGDMDVPRRFSINPLAAGGNDLNFDVPDEEPNAEDVDNVYFNTINSHTSEPTTEL